MNLFHELDSEKIAVKFQKTLGNKEQEETLINNNQVGFWKKTNISNIRVEEEAKKIEVSAGNTVYCKKEKVLLLQEKEKNAKLETALERYVSSNRKEKKNALENGEIQVEFKNKKGNYSTNLYLCLHEVKSLRQTESKLNEKTKVWKKQHNYRINQLYQIINEERKILLSYMTPSIRDTPYPGIINYMQYAKPRYKILPLIGEKPLKPEFGSVINDVTSFLYPITISPCPQIHSDNNRSVFIAVISATGNFKNRDMIRKTWMRDIKTVLDNNHMRHGFTIYFAFFVGMTKNVSLQEFIEKESYAHSDIVQINMSDIYVNLPMKMAGVLNWMILNCLNKIDFVFKVDDDVFINVRNLVRFVLSKHNYNMSLFGIPMGLNNSAIFLSHEEWPWNNYPSYLSGPAYLLHGSTILPLLAASQTIPMIYLEDIYLTGLCAEMAGIKLLFPNDIPRFGFINLSHIHNT
jgi:hypothetical protein